MHFNEIKNIIALFIGRLCDFLCVAFWLLVIFGFDEPYIAVITIISTVIHELGHEISFLHFGGSVKKPKGKANGLRIFASGFASYREEILSYAAGPIANLIAMLIGLLLSPFMDGYALTFALLNGVTAFTNLLPIRSQDGYGIALGLINRYEIEWGERALRCVSLFLSSLLCFFSLYLLKTAGEGLWIFGFFYVSLLCSLFSIGNNDL
ncbi:MAG: hypothetical protein J6Q85_05190 [Clostridia bacterium]|nr:hypothetical protein [Clostridia bacterium]